MKIAIPVAGERVAVHFGHCEEFLLIDISDDAPPRIVRQERVSAPAHEPGLLPRWLHERGVTVVLAGGMGQRAAQGLVDCGIELVTGVPDAEPAQIVRDYLAGTLQSGANVCDH